MSIYASVYPKKIIEPDVVLLTPSGLAATDVSAIAESGARLSVTTEVKNIVAMGRAVVERTLERGDVVYGLNTHLGHRRNEAIDSDDIWLYQDFVIATHTGGIGASLSKSETVAVLVSRVAGMARGGSGISLEVFNLLVKMINHRVLPVIPSIGSVGASDLTQLAAVAEVVTGRGFVWDGDRQINGKEALAKAGLLPATLGPKEALTIISANSASIGLGALLLDSVERISDLADEVGSLTLEAVSANLSPFAAVVAGSKSFSGQARVAVRIRRLMKGSRLENLSASTSVQDAISLRTIPQVHGALRDQLEFTTQALAAELNAAADNPVVSFTEDRLVSNGNFAPITMTLAFESLRLALAHVGLLSERRLHKLLAIRYEFQCVSDITIRTRIPNLIVNAAASLVAELRHTAQAVTLNAVSLNRDVEDHSSLAPHSVELTRNAADIVENLLTIEAILAADTISLFDENLKMGNSTREMYECIQLMFSKSPSSSTSHLVNDARKMLREYQS